MWRPGGEQCGGQEVNNVEAMSEQCGGQEVNNVEARR
jgi:hypothetical protein